MSNVENREIVLRVGAREVTVAAVLLVLFMGAFSGVTYVAGRTIVAVEASSPSEQPPEQILVIEAPKDEDSAPEQVAVSTEAPITTSPPVAEVPAKRTAEPPEPRTGDLFYQVAAADLGIAEVFVEYLSQRSFSSLIAEGPDERNYRVLVGPIQTSKQVEELRAGLEAAGFKPFLRRYYGNGVAN